MLRHRNRKAGQVPTVGGSRRRHATRFGIVALGVAAMIGSSAVAASAGARENRWLDLQRSVSKDTYLTANPDLDNLRSCQTFDGIVIYNGKSSRGLDCVESSILDSLDSNAGRVTSANFDPKLYRAVNTDLPSNWSEYDLARHFDQSGRFERRTASLCGDRSVFDYTYYTQHNQDLAAAGVVSTEAVCAHFYGYGLNEGRQASATFSVRRYQELNGDLSGLSPRDAAIHYVRYGRAEGRAAV